MTQHLRSNAIAYLALFVALGGTGAYAASKIDSGDIKDNTIKGKDIRANQVAGSDVRDESLTGADIADDSLQSSDIQNRSLLGDDVSAETKVPNADMLDGHGSTRYGVGLQMGAALNLPVNTSEERFPVGVTTGQTEVRAISPEVLEIRDFTAFSPDLQDDETITVELVGGSPGGVCSFQGGEICHLESNVQHAIGGQDEWSLRFTTSNTTGVRDVSYSYRAVR